MGKYILNNQYKRISFHSHPRSGTNFLARNLCNILDVGIEFMGKENPYTINSDPYAFQVVVIRNPIDCIFSSYAHGEYGKELTQPILDSLEIQTKKYIEYLEIYERFSKSLNIYDFNDLDKVLEDIALNFIDKLPEGFIPQFPKPTKNFIPSMKDNEFYKELKSMNLNPSIFNDAIKAYNYMLEKTLKL